MEPGPTGTGSSAHEVPLGAPGFAFPKLPNLRSPSSVVDASAFAHLGGDDGGDPVGPPTEGGASRAALANEVSEEPLLEAKRRADGSYSELPASPPTRDRWTASTSTTTSSTRPPTRRTAPSGPSTSLIPTASTSTTTSGEVDRATTTLKQAATPNGPPPPRPQSSAGPTGPTERTSQAGPRTRPASARRPSAAYESRPPYFLEPEVITAPSLPPPPPPGRSSRPFSPEGPTGALGHSLGFDPESVVYESDFRPVRREPAGPVLAFRVSPSDAMPFRGPQPPRPAGPRTSGLVRFSHRNIRFEGGGGEDSPKEAQAAATPVLRRVTALVPFPDDLEAAASTLQVFASDGRPLSTDGLPRPPQLASGRRLTAASITSRPQIGPFRGSRPPPVPSRVPHLPQFSRQRRPSGRRRAAVGLLPPPPSASPSTNLAILEDVWATLTREDPGLRADHPRDDARPDHARPERRRRETGGSSTEADASSSLPLASVIILNVLLVWRAR